LYAVALKAAVTLLLAQLHWPAVPMFALVMVSVAVGCLATRRHGGAPEGATAVQEPPRWDIPVRMVVATGVVVAITALAPAIGARLAGLLSPFPVFGAVVAVFTHLGHGPTAASATLAGLIMGLAARAVFFLVLALSLPGLGLPAFGLAALAALVTQAGTLIALPAAHS
jgi:hypothetical protein